MSQASQKTSSANKARAVLTLLSELGEASHVGGAAPSTLGRAALISLSRCHLRHCFLLYTTHSLPLFQHHSLSPSLLPASARSRAAFDSLTCAYSRSRLFEVSLPRPRSLPSKQLLPTKSDAAPYPTDSILEPSHPRHRNLTTTTHHTLQHTWNPIHTQRTTCSQ